MLDERIAQAMLSGCVVATVQPEVQHGECFLRVLLVVMADVKMFWLL